MVTAVDPPICGDGDAAAGAPRECHEGAKARGKVPYCFFAVGDWGKNSEAVQHLADRMAKCAQRMQPQMILALGDNFYPGGVTSVQDPLFKTVWEDIFLCHEELRVPWKVCLGNHDYYGCPEAQIDFTRCPLNPGGLWQCDGQNYTFTAELPDGGAVDFFALDTNGCQESVRRARPHLKEDLRHYIRDLDEKLRQSQATWKVVFGHHPMYTKGVNHGRLGRCLRDDKYEVQTLSGERVCLPGYGLEKVLIANGVDAYFSGHEHLLQQHSCGGVGHFVCGASGAEAIGLYGGEDMQPRDSHPQWADGVSGNRAKTASQGFAVCVADSGCLTVAFLDVDGRVLRAVRSLASQAGEWEVHSDPEAALNAALERNAMTFEHSYAN